MLDKDELGENAMRGVAWLEDRQNDDGRWEDSESTGTGFPNHLYLRYHMYAHYFPLMVLGRFRKESRAPELGKPLGGSRQSMSLRPSAESAVKPSLRGESRSGRKNHLSSQPLGLSPDSKSSNEP
jgi:hypothetical protein